MPKIVLSSILKSVLDTRMYEKLGKSISSIDNTEIHIIGQRINQNLPSSKKIFFHPIFHFSRLGKERLLAPFKAFKKIIQIRPDILIVGTHELLWIGVLYKLLFWKKLIYNVEENYIKNIWYTNAFPSLLRPFLVGYVFLKEWFCSFFISEHWLAEKSYEQELGFAIWKGNYKVIENKFQGVIQQRPTQKKLQHFIYTGTIGENYGIFDCIQLIDNLHQIDSTIHLTIIGYCSQHSILKKLKENIQHKEYIQLIGGDHLVPHQEILQKIKEADCGILSYQSNPSTDNCIPTKLYEYLAHHLPMICVNNPYWEKIIHQYGAGICVDFQEVEYIYDLIHSTAFYPKSVDHAVLWSTEEKNILTSF